VFRPFAGSGEWQAARGQEARASRGRRGAKGAALRVAILCWKLLRSRLQRGGSSPEKSRGALRRAGCGWGHSRAPASKKRPGPLAGVMRETHGKTGCARQDRPSAGERLFRRRIYHATTSQIDRSGMGGDFSTGLKYRGLVPGFAGNHALLILLISCSHVFSRCHFDGLYKVVQQLLLWFDTRGARRLTSAG